MPKGEASPSGGAQTPLVNVSELAKLITQARGPVLDRLERGLSKFRGDGTQDVQKWLDDFEHRCGLEGVEPADMVMYLLEGGARRVYDAMMVADAKQWVVVRAALMAQFGLSRQEAWRQFMARQLRRDESVDVFVGDLLRLAARLGASEADMTVRVHFLEGLRAGDRSWAVMLPDAYTCPFSDLVSRVRSRVASYRATAPSERAAAAQPAGNVGAVERPGKRQGLACFRCGGPHPVRQCVKSGVTNAPAGFRRGGGKPLVCFNCRGQGHMARDCPSARMERGAGAGFSEEGAERGTASSTEDCMEGV